MQECRQAFPPLTFGSKWSVLWSASGWRWSVVWAWGSHYSGRSDSLVPPRAGRSRCPRHPRVPLPPSGWEPSPLHVGCLPLWGGPGLSLWARRLRPAGPSGEPGKRADLSPGINGIETHYYFSDRKTANIDAGCRYVLHLYSFSFKVQCVGFGEI